MRCSLIIPAFNEERTIINCLRSAFNQRLADKDYEIIIVDDGSTDQTAEIVKQFPVRLIQQQNEGPATARNRGASEALGKILVFTDSDCVLDSAFLENIILPLENNSEIVGVQGIYRTKQREYIAQFGQVEIETRYKLMEINRYIDFIGTYAAAYKKDIFLKSGGFDTGFRTASGEDAEFSYRLSNKGYKMILNKQAYVYHTHPYTIKQYLKIKFWRAYWRMLAYKKNPQKAIKDSYTPQALKLQILLAGMIGLSIIFIPFIGGWIICFLLILFFISIIPFLVMAFKKSIFLGILSPWLLFARAYIFLMGNLSGLFYEVLKLSRKNTEKNTQRSM